MTLKLVDNIIQLYEEVDLPTLLREFADDVQAGHFPGAIRVLSVVQRDGGMTIVPIGKPIESYEIIGLFEAAKFNALADMIIPDEE